MERTPPSPRSAKKLAEDLAALPAASAAEDTTSFVFVQAGPPTRRAQALDAVARTAPAAAAYDLGGGELAVLAPAELEHVVLRGLRTVRQDGVRWGVAHWPDEDDDPAVVLDLAAQRAGRRTGGVLAARWAVAGVAAALIAALVLPATRSEVVPIAASLRQTRITGAAAGAEVDREVRLLTPAVSSEPAPATSTVPPFLPPPTSAPFVPPPPPVAASGGALPPFASSTTASPPATTARPAPAPPPAPPTTGAPAPAPAPSTTAAPRPSPTTAPPRATTTTTTPERDEDEDDEDEGKTKDKGKDGRD